jgi:hypothetical protein
LFAFWEAVFAQHNPLIRFSFFPSSLSGQSRYVLALFRSEMLGSGFSALQSTSSAFTDWFSLRFADCVLSFTYGDFENLLGKLDGIARTFGHETSIA